MWEFEKDNRQPLHNLSDLDEKEQYFILELIKKTFTPISSFNTKFSSDKLRINFSNAFFYITPELFVEAMVKSGFKTSGNHIARTYFNISSKSSYTKAINHRLYRTSEDRTNALIELAKSIPEI